MRGRIVSLYASQRYAAVALSLSTRHLVVDHLQEAAGDREAGLLAAAVDAQRAGAEQRHQRRVAAQDAQAAVVRRRDHLVGLALAEEKALTLPAIELG